jgi:surface protein
MFYNCKALEIITADSSTFATPSLSSSNSASMFYGCAALVGGMGTAYNSNIQTSDRFVVDSEKNAGYVTDPNLTPASRAILTSNGVLTFAGAGPLLRPGSYYNGSYVTACDGTIAALEGLYGNYTAVTSIRMVDDIVFPGTSMKEYFSGWTGLTTANLTRLDISNVTNLSYAFSGCTALTTLDISTWTASNVTNTSYMFQNCKVLKSLNLEGFTPGKLTTISYMFSGCAALTTITVKSENFKTAYISSSNSTKAFYGCSSLVGGLGTAYDSSYVDVTRLAVDTSTVAGYLTDNSVEADARAILLNTGVLLFTGPGKFIAPGTYYSSSGYYGTVLAFDGSLKSLDGIEPSKTSVTSIVALDGAVMPYSSMAAMFKNYTKLTTVNLSKMDVSAVTSFSELFYGCTALTSVSLAGWNTSNVTNMSSMFYNCKLLTSLDLTSFSQTKLSYTESMFYGCAALATIKVDSETFGTKSISSSNSSKMFYGCTALLGGLGTPFDSSYVDKTRFVVDTANTLGYLTDPNLQSEAQFIVLANTTLVIAGKGTFIAPGSYYYYNGYNRLVTSSDGSIASLEGIASDKTKITQIVVASSGATIPVTSMKEMFSGFTALTSVSFKGLGTSNVTSWYKLFYGCTKLSSITFSGIDTSSISEMSYAFYNCKALTELDLAGLDFSALRYTTSAFYNCSSLFTIYADENWSPSNLSSYSDMFTGCTSLVGNLGTVFSSSYTGKTYACLDTSTQKGYFSPKGHVTDAPFAVMSSDYKVFILEPGVVPRPGTYKTIEGYSRYIAAVDGSIGKFDNFTDYAKVTYVSVVNEVQMPANASTGLFKDWAKLATVSLAKLDTSLVTSMYEWFSGCSVLASINLSSWNMSNVTNLGYFLSGCKALTSLDLTGLDFSALKTTNYMFNNCSALFTIYVDDNWSESKLTFSSGMFTGCTSLVGNLGTVHNTSYVDGTYARLDTSTQKGYFTPKDRMTDAPFAVMSSDYKVFILEPGVVPRPGDIKTIEGYSRTIAAVDGSIGSFDNFTSYAKVTYVSAVNEVQMPANTSTALFKGWSLLATVNLAKLDTSLVTSMYEWFSGCSVLTAANLSGWDTSNVTNMGYLFNNCKKLTSINLTGWNTSNVTAMHYMFYYNAVTTLDLSSFDTSSLKQTNYMFRYCTSLTTIYVNPNTWSMWSGINSSNMFTNCTSLVGEQGTKYSSSYTDLAYARVDEGTEKPGYLWSRIPETAESMVDVVVEEVAPSVDVVDDATLELEENLEVASNENEVQEVGDSDVETSDTAEKDAEVVAPGEDAGEDDTFIQESETTDGSGEAGFAEESAGIIDPEGLKAAEIDEATVEPQVEESELVTLSFEEVAAAVAVVPAGMLLAALRRRAA